MALIDEFKGKYKTNLTEQQYRSNEGRVEAFSKPIRDKLIKKEITVEEAREKILTYAKKLGLLTKIHEDTGREVIVHSSEIFEHEEKEPSPMSRYELKKYTPKTKDIIAPKEFYTVGERNEPCKIVDQPNVRTIMLNSSNYSHNVNREAHYALCKTPTGIKVTSPIFGSREQLSSRRFNREDMCWDEFGYDSKEIGEFHTHPEMGGEGFSLPDMLSYKKANTPLKYNNSSCIVSKVIEKGKEKTRVRCTRNVDADRFLSQLEFNLKDLGSESVRNAFDTKYVRDPSAQNAFSCVVDIDEKDVEPKKSTISKVRASKTRKESIRSQIKRMIPRRRTGEFDFGEGINIPW